MRRREFFRASVTTGLAMAGSTIASDCLSAETPSKDDEGAKRAGVQSDDDVVIHPFESAVMRGSPPAKDKVVTLDTYEYVHAHRVWAQQHMRELCPTQLISRGRGPVAVLPRKRMDIDGLQIKDLGGNLLTVRQLLEKTFG